MLIKHRIASITLGTLMATGLGCGEDAEPGPIDNEAQGADETPEATTRLTGRLLDTDGQAVGQAEVSLAVGSVEVTARTLTTSDGLYALDVPVAAIETARANSQEISVLFHSPTTDLEPLGTVEGDYVQLLPATLDEFVDLDQIGAEALEMRTAYVPRQGHGFAISDELIANGGVLTWSPEGTQYGEGFSVSLIVEPGSIHRGDSTQDELTLTVLEQAVAPMQIPEDGFGPLWTIQPRDITFDPPARVRIQGQRMPVLGPNDMAVGEQTDLYGASLETGWKYFGAIEMTDDDAEGRITLETTGGIITHGAWGHVFGNAGSDWGALIQCYAKRPAGDPQKWQIRVPCVVLDDNKDSCTDGDTSDHSGMLKCEQIDYNGDHYPLYSTVMEPRCRGCGGDTAPTVLAMGIDDPTAADLANVVIRVKAAALCDYEEPMEDMNALWDSVSSRYQQYNPGANRLYDVTDDSVDATLSWRNFSKTAKIEIPEPINCAE